MFQTSGILEEILAKEMKQEFLLCVLGSLEERKGLRAPPGVLVKSSQG